MKFFQKVMVIGVAVFMIVGIGIAVLYWNKDRQQEDIPRENALSGEEISSGILEEWSKDLAQTTEVSSGNEGSLVVASKSGDESAGNPVDGKASGSAADSKASESVAESKPTESAAESKAAESKAAESKAAESKAAESKAAESKAAESKAAESKAAESKAAESKAAESKAAESKAAENKALTDQDGSKTDANAGQGTQDQLVDKQAPVFLAFTASPQIKVGNKFDVHKYCGYADDVDRHVDMEVTGTVDTSKEGTYPITIKLTDDAGRVTKKDMSVHVVSKTGSSGGSGKKENFSDFVKNYKTEETSVGIDISRWQETVDFEKIKAAGCEFVYMRLGGYDNGELYTDRYYLQNMAGAKAAGLKVGIYWHSEESSRAEMKTSIDYLMKVLDGQQLDFPIAFDWEDFMNFEDHGMNLYDINDLLDGFAEEIEARGYKACLYGSKNKLETLWNLYKKKLPIWLAHYTGSTNYGGDYFMWQHSCTGRIDGINGDVDLDVLYNGKANFQ